MATGQRQDGVLRQLLILLVLTCSPWTAVTAGWRAGVGRVDITPSEPVWLSGYAARRKPL